MTGYYFTKNTLRDGRPIPPIGEWFKDEGPVSEHPFDALHYANGCMIHRVEVEGDLKSRGKQVGRGRKILASINAKPIFREFALWCASPVIGQYLETADKIHRVEGWTKARAAAWAEGWKAAWAARSATGWTKARSEAWETAWVAAWLAGWEEARAAGESRDWAARSATVRATAWKAGWREARRIQRKKFAEMVEKLLTRGRERE